MTRRLGEVAQVIAVMAVLAVFVAFMVETAVALRPAPPDDGLRREPPATVWARVETPHGPGVITAEVRYWDGPLWLVRLDSGPHVVLPRARMRVVSVP